ncbi:MAG: magnesium/cobalt transporter CorA [Melioribacteraceae bacterium]|nr:magnesium/cobalt transporter CorA [Melioribacteraceae bacterium]
MSKKSHIKSKIGKPPGTLLYLGNKAIKDSKVTLTVYDEDIFEVHEINSFNNLKELLSKTKEESVKWINIIGVKDIEFLKLLGEHFKISNLILEDVLNSYQRPKIEINHDFLFVVTKRPYYNNDDYSIEHNSYIMNDRLLISIQDAEIDFYKDITERIKNGLNVFRKMKTDYLLYVLLDLSVDNYLLVFEEFQEKSEALEEKLIYEPVKEDLSSIQELKKTVQAIRQSLRPTREILNSLVRRESNFISEGAVVYFRDTLDHQLQLNDTLEASREMVSSLMEIYLSSINNKMNEVMKVLTIIATIFIPLTFIAGLYGMNFEFMPELKWHWGYPLTLLVMFLITLILIIYFKKKDWM